MVLFSSTVNLVLMKTMSPMTCQRRVQNRGLWEPTLSYKLFTTSPICFNVSSALLYIGYSHQLPSSITHIITHIFRRLIVYLQSPNTLIQYPVEHLIQDHLAQPIIPISFPL